MFNAKNGKVVIERIYKVGVDEYSISDFYTRGVGNNPQAWYHLLLLTGIDIQDMTDVVAYLFHDEQVTGDSKFTDGVYEGFAWSLAQMLDAMYQVERMRSANNV